jgi:2-aminoadipate transaminase
MHSQVPVWTTDDGDTSGLTKTDPSSTVRRPSSSFVLRPSSSFPATIPAMPAPLLQLSQRPGIIELTWGHPDPALLPVDALRRAGEMALAQYGADAMQYGHPAGPGPLLEWLAERIGRQEGRAPALDEIMTTGGISLGLDQLLTLLAVPGDTVLVETPSYHLAVRILRDHKLNLVPVPCDEGGLRLDALVEILARLKTQGVAPRGLYLVPTFNNPTGRCLADDRRQALVDLAQAEQLLIIEDDVYRELAYDSPAPASLWSLAAPGVVARLGSFSKSLGPGLRLGWLTGGAELVQRIVDDGLLDSGGGINHYTALVVAALCAAGDYDRNLEALRRSYRHRRDVLIGALREQLPAGWQVRAPGGGFFSWVELPAGADSRDLRPLAERAGVSFLPGATFHLDGGGQNGLRLAFSLYPAETLAEAAGRLGVAAREFAGVVNQGGNEHR